MDDDDRERRKLLPALLTRHRYATSDMAKVATIALVIVFLVWVLLT